MLNRQGSLNSGQNNQGTDGVEKQTIRPGNKAAMVSFSFAIYCRDRLGGVGMSGLWAQGKVLDLQPKTAAVNWTLNVLNPNNLSEKPGDHITSVII